MKSFRVGALCLSLVAAFIAWGVPVFAQETTPTAPAEQPATTAQPAAQTADQVAQGPVGVPGAGAAAAVPQFPPFADVLGDAEAVPGLITLYKKKGRLFADLNGSHLNQDFIVLSSIAAGGIGEGPLLAGWTSGMGDWLWQFRKVDDAIHIVSRNVRFTAAAGSPEENAVRLAYHDSVLFSLPIVTMSPAGGVIVDLTPVFMGDLPQLGQLLPGFFFAPDKSTWSKVKSLRDNVELEVAATYASGGGQEIDTVADSRGLPITVHYSISRLPQTGYQPRLADDRVGYFVTALKDFSRNGELDRFVRYVNRWDLQKIDAAAEVSMPRKPIVFWLEKTIPFKYRKPISDGILEWNLAFEKAGFYNAVEVRQQPDNADWDPEDINYNTFRWITSGTAFAIGPSRVNPLTGQILDADILFDADWIQAWREDYENLTVAGVAAMTGGPLDLLSYEQEQARRPEGSHFHCGPHCCDLHSGLARQMALGSAVFQIRHGQEGQAMEEKMIMQAIKEVTMHEVGHTLGLRHNFKSSTSLTLEEANNPEITKTVGLTASVMDYAPANIVPQGVPQGDYFSTTIGPYDYWAIEYGYKPLGGGTAGEVAELVKVAARSGEPGLSFATDEDTRGIDSDPLSNRYDLGTDAVAYARQRATLVGQLMPGLIERVTTEGEGYQKARQAFGILLSNYGMAMHMASRNVGGIYVNRDHRGDAGARAPFVVVPADKQREALALMEESIFNDKPFQFPPELYNHLASSRWSHWGVTDAQRLDYKVHEVISIFQGRVLDQLLSSLTLTRLHDSELKVPADQDAFTAAELIERLTKAVFTEIDTAPAGEYTNRKPYVSSLRRNLQRNYLGRLSNLAMNGGSAPDDCQTIAFAELTALEAKINTLLAAGPALDSYSRAHLTESASRIHKALDARLTLSAP